MDANNHYDAIVIGAGPAGLSASVILSPGGRSKTLGVPGEDAFKGRGISYCATCDGDFFTDKEIVVDADMATNIEGVYAAGDSVAKRFRQITTAVADGTIAALAASEYINEKTHNECKLL